MRMMMVSLEVSLVLLWSFLGSRLPPEARWAKGLWEEVSEGMEELELRQSLELKKINISSTDVCTCTCTMYSTNQMQGTNV